MGMLVRWGRSAYETEADLALERSDAHALGFDWVLEPGPAPLAVLRKAEVLVVTSGVRVHSEVLDAFPGKLLIATTSGVDHIDIEGCASRGIAVARLPEARRDAVVEHALAAMIALMRRFPSLDAYARNDIWARDRLPELAPVALADATVAVVGLGVIGRRMAEVLTTLGARVVAVDPSGVPPQYRSMDLDDALAIADAATLHCALTASSRRLFDRARIARMRPTSVLVNTARGEVVDVLEAVEAVQAGSLRGFSTDVFPVEPYPSLSAARIPGVQFTPHSAGFVHDLGRRVAQGVRRALEAWRRGNDVPHRVV